MNIFIYNDYKSPPCDLSPEEAKEQLREAFPELAKATWTSKKKGEHTVYTFVKKSGTKASDIPACPWCGEDEEEWEDDDGWYCDECDISF